MTATERRYEAVGAITHEFINSRTGRFNTKVVTRATVIARIQKLSSLGRTDRWKLAVENWAMMVQCNPLRWAILQGAIFTNFAA